MYSEERLRIDNLTAAVSTLKTKYATPDEVFHHQAITKCLVISLSREVNTAVGAYIDEEYDEGKIEKISGLGENAIQEACDWLDDLEQAWSTIRTREILVLEEMRKNVDTFQPGGRRSMCL